MPRIALLALAIMAAGPIGPRAMASGPTVPLTQILATLGRVTTDLPLPREEADPGFWYRLAMDYRDLANVLGESLDHLAPAVTDQRTVIAMRKIRKDMANIVQRVPDPKAELEAARTLALAARERLSSVGQELSDLSRRSPEQRLPLQLFDEILDAIEERPRTGTFEADDLPAKLSETGLYEDIATKKIAAGLHHFEPQYPLWTDGAAKSRWIRLPAGTKVTTTDLDRWVFPVGTAFWKEFTFLGKRVETRLIRKVSQPAAPQSWQFATYRWNDSETEATRVPVQGMKDVAPTGFQGPHGPILHDIPSAAQCLRCHSRGGDAVLGFDVLQLSPDRDPRSPHAVPSKPGDLDLPRLAQLGLVTGVPSHPPRIQSTTTAGRAAMGFLHGNCAHCHNPGGAARHFDMYLRHTTAASSEVEEPAYATTVNKLTEMFEIPGRTVGVDARRIEGGDPDHSCLFLRPSIRGDDQMPPIGTEAPNDAAAALLREWIQTLPPPTGAPR